MNGYQIDDSDWILFQSKIGAWQEAAINKLNQEYIEMLSQEGPPSEKFWTLNERIKQDKKKASVLLDSRKSILVYNILNLIDEGTITMEDLDAFSEELKEVIRSAREL